MYEHNEGSLRVRGLELGLERVDVREQRVHLRLRRRALGHGRLVRVRHVPPLPIFQLRQHSLRLRLRQMLWHVTLTRASVATDMRQTGMVVRETRTSGPTVKEQRKPRGRGLCQAKRAGRDLWRHQPRVRSCHSRWPRVRACVRVCVGT